MEFRQLIITQKDSSTRYVFNHKVNLVTSTLLSEELLKENYNLENSTYMYESLDNLPLGDVFQIKVRIASTGIVMVVFKKDALSEETKQTMFNEISTLKDNQTPTLELQKQKISNLIDIVNKYSPEYIAFANTGDFLFVKSSFDEITANKEIDFPVLVLLTPIGYVDTPSDKNKKRKQANKQPVVKKDNSTGSFKDIVPQLKSLDFIFFGIFSIFIAFGLIISIFEILNGEGIAAFLLILTVAFVITLNYATYKANQDSPYFQYKIKNMIIPAIYMALGIIIGIVLGYLITSFVLKVKDEIVINYTLVYGLSIPLSILFVYSSLALPIPLTKLFSKIKKNKK